MAEQAVIVRFTLNGGEFGTRHDRDFIYKLERDLERALKGKDIGEIDGHEIGDQTAVIYAYGSDARRLFLAMEPLLRSCPLRDGQVILRFGDVDAPLSCEETVELS